jgi:hypothetical protein
MKNVGLILIAVIGTSLASFAQDGTKKTEPKKKAKKETVAVDSKKINAPAKKIKQ